MAGTATGGVIISLLAKDGVFSWHFPEVLGVRERQPFKDSRQTIEPLPSSPMIGAPESRYDPRPSKPCVISNRRAKILVRRDLRSLVQRA
jgi:hypothetical protein